MNKELKIYIEENLKNNSFSKESFLTSKARCSSIEAVGEYSSFEDSIDLKEWIKENDKYNTFQTTLFKMIDEKNLTDSEVYNKVHIDRRLFSKIRNDKNYHPSKETIILLGLSMELNENEIEELLNSASYSLPKNNHYDLIIRFCFMKGIYTIKDVNELLEEYNCKLFSY